ncbi:hypothetical protein B0H11DRAFT_2040776 [Mycena galericulata]|nr:hypothetical protein B0H11DRAFT_2040776 [Mycena galericulata]
MAEVLSETATRKSRWRQRKKSIQNRKNNYVVLNDAIHNPESSSTMYFGEIQAAQMELPFSRDRKQSTGGVTYMSEQPPYSDAQAEIRVFPSLPTNPTEKPAGSTPPFPRNRKRSIGAERDEYPPFNRGQTATNPSPPLKPNPSERSGSFFRFPRNAKRALGTEKPEPKFTSLPSAMKSSASLGPPKKVSFVLPFTRKRNRSTGSVENPGQIASMPMAMESSPSLVENTSRKPSSIYRLFGNRKGSEGVKPTDMQSVQPSPGSSSRPVRELIPARTSPLSPKENPATHSSRWDPPSGQRENYTTPGQMTMGSYTSGSHVDKTSKKPSSIMSFLRDRKRSMTLKKPEKRDPPVSNAESPGLGAHNIILPSGQLENSTAAREASLQTIGGAEGSMSRNPGFAQAKENATLLSAQPPEESASSSGTLNPHAPEFIPRGLDKNKNVTEGISATAVITSTESNSLTDRSNLVTIPSEPPVRKPSIDPSGVYVPPHRRRKNTNTGIFLKPLTSTVVFPTVKNDESGPDVESGISGEPKEDLVFNLSETSKYWIYKNLLNVLWTEAKAQNNLQIQHDINKSCLSENNSSSPELSGLTSALESQRYLLELAATLGLDGDAKISEALCNDRREIRTRLISAQKAILEQTEDAHCILDLVQDIIDDSNNNNFVDTRLNRLIVKLSFACGRLPSSLSITDVEQRSPHAVGGGGYGDIFTATWRSRDSIQLVALKQLRFNHSLTKEDIQRSQEKFCHEALLWKNLSHDFIIPLIGIYCDESDLGPFSMSMVCPWMKNGTILKYLQTSPSNGVDTFLHEIAQGLCYLHSQLVVHGDLRGENILVDDHGHARLADFGLATYANATVKSSLRAGSLRWMAPELLDPRIQDGFRRTYATDVHAFACVCYELYTRKSPFSDIPLEGAVMFEVIAGRRPKRVPIIPLHTWRVIQECWCQQPDERLSSKIIVEKLDMIQRNSVESAKTSPKEPQEVYKPPRSLGISQNASSTPSLPRTSSLIVNVLSAPFKHDAGLRRRNSSCIDLFPTPDRVIAGAQESWRQGRRTMSMFLRKGNGGDIPTPTIQETGLPPSQGNSEGPKRRRILSFRF